MNEYLITKFSGLIPNDLRAFLNIWRAPTLYKGDLIVQVYASAESNILSQVIELFANHPTFSLTLHDALIGPKYIRVSIHSTDSSCKSTSSTPS